jgi:hypothetical protein
MMSKVVKCKFKDQVDTERAPDADTADAAAATPATPATPPDAGAAAASGRGRSSYINCRRTDGDNSFFLRIGQWRIFCF